MASSQAVLIDLLRAGAAADPARPLALTPTRSLSYGDALASALAVAAGLRERGIARFGAVMEDTADAVVLLCAASAVGAEACMYPRTLSDDEVASFAESFGHPIVVRAAEFAELAAAAPAELPAPDAAPVLILTTGTTGRPKAAQHDWARLAAGVRRPDATPGNRWLLAYNINQFAGLQVVLHVLTSTATLVVPASNQPRDALAAMQLHGVTHASATPTFWRFQVALLDPGSASSLPLQQITLGGEAVPAGLLEDLAKLFPSVRVSQVYASTEFGTSVSIGDGRNGLPLSVLDRPEDAEVRFKIVDGELHAKSRIGMLGYLGAEGGDADGWRPTGDLVEIEGDRILFVGRTSEVINVGGVKVHPLPVEEAIGAVDGVEVVHVYGRKNPMSGEIVQADVVAREGSDLEALEDAIRDACEAALAPAARPRRIKFVESIGIREQKIDRRKAQT